MQRDDCIFYERPYILFLFVLLNRLVGDRSSKKRRNDFFVVFFLPFFGMVCKIASLSILV